MNVLEHFPFDSFRKFQKETILKIDEYFNDYDYVILESPTGSGKSAIAMTIALAYKNAYLLTSQKILQDQYVKDFINNQNIKVLKGRSNYPCIALNEKEDCSKGICTVQKCSLIGECYYYVAKAQAMTSQVALLNYSYFLRVKNFGTNFPSRKLLICDEGHSVEQEVLKFVEFRLSEFYLDRLGITSKVPIFKETKHYVDWISDIRNLIINKIRDLSEQIKTVYRINEEKTAELMSEKDNLSNLEGNMKYFLDSISDTEWIFDIEKSERLKKKSIVFKPLTVRHFTKEKLFSAGQKKLLMSATILDCDSYVKSLGIENEKVKFLQVDSTFPIENRKIYLTNSGKMSFNVINKTLPKVVEDINKMLKYHEGQKGIIHTHSYKISKYLEENLDDERLLFPTSENREAMLKLHCKSKDPTILVSPSMTDGIDLPDDLARFCVIVKIPYPSLGDKRVKLRMEEDSKWYRWLTSLSMMQASGRGIRHEKDYCNIYFMDSGIKYFIKQNRENFPNYFIKSIRN